MHLLNLFLRRAVGGVTTPSHWTITGPVSLDLQPPASDPQPSSTAASMSLDLAQPGPVSVELGASGHLEFEFESMSPR